MDICLARQPIFDQDDRVVAYELLYRSAPQASRAEGLAVEQMSSRVVVDALLGIGLDQITDSVPAFMNISRDLLLSDAIELIDPRLVVIELLESIQPDAEVVAACERLRAAGYRIALDDFTFDPSMEPLLRLASTVKIDVLMYEPDELAALVERLAPFHLTLLAEKVETQAVRQRCAELGFRLFQGYFFGRPEILAERDVPLEQLNTIRLLNLLADPNSPDAEVEEAFRADVGLSYKLLRIVNSAALGGRGITSIGHALRLLGRTMLHRWLTLLMVTTVPRRNDYDRELVHSAMVRARMGELIGLSNGGGLRDPSGLYMVGLLSLLDALMRVPMERIVDHIDLATPVRDALLDRTGEYGRRLRLIEQYEAGVWDEVITAAAELALDLARLAEFYVDAVRWTREQLRAISA